MTDFRATYRLQLGPGFGFAEAAALVRTWPGSASRTSTCRRPFRRARAPRTATTWSTRPRSRASSAARRRSTRWSRPCAAPGWGSCSTSSPTTWRPTPPTASGRTGRCGAVLRHRPGHRAPPALLRRRPPRRAAPGGPGGLRGDARAGAAARQRGRRRRAADRSPRRAGRPGGLPAAPARRRRRARVGGEDPRPRRAAARLADRGHRRLRVPQRRLRAVRRPGGRGAADRPVGGDLRRRPALRRARLRGQARADADDVRARGRAAAARRARRG